MDRNRFGPIRFIRGLNKGRLPRKTEHGAVRRGPLRHRVKVVLATEVWSSDRARAAVLKSVGSNPGNTMAVTDMVTVPVGMGSGES